MSNSKLSREQNLNRKSLKRELLALGGSIGLFGQGVTVCQLPEFEGSKMSLVSISIASEDEIKTRRKVGEYHALQRMFNSGEYIKVKTEYFDPGQFAYSVA